ncbi:MAG TPA: lytic murein transglycosylase [Jatrophihabitans sp.]|nr:lytic murein transglycosylase [Jatrophihabitans sp.]
MVAAAFAVALLSVLALVLSNAGGSAAAERTHRPAAAQSPLGHPAAVSGSSSSVGLIADPRAAPRGYSSVSSSSAASASAPTVPVDTAPPSALLLGGIPATALAAYREAAARQDALTPGCHIGWPLLAAIGRVESNHGRFAGAVLHADGLSTPPVVGIPLNGHGTALIRDTDGGRLDGDAVYDRAVGPMQFIPSTWARWGVDADHDGVKNPFDIFDATAAAAAYLCAAGRDLATSAGQVEAILSYNHSFAYVALVMQIERVYASGSLQVAILPTVSGPGSAGVARNPRLPAVDPGRPRGLDSGHPSSTPHSSGPVSSSSHSSAASTSKSSKPSTSNSSPGGTPSGSSSNGSPSSSTSPTCSPSSSPSASSASTSTSTPSCEPSGSSPAAGSTTTAENAASKAESTTGQQAGASGS